MGSHRRRTTTEKKAKALIVDCNFVCHAVKNATKEMSFRGNKTGVVFGFLRKVLPLLESCKPDVTVFAWDSRYKLRRATLFAGYKEKRQDVDDEMRQLNAVAMPQFYELRDFVLPAMGFRNVFYQVGLEGDDVIASLVMHNKGFEKFVVSTDKDLWQLLNYCSLCGLDGKVVMTKEQFVQAWKMEPYMWAEVKSIAGCTGDEVPGVSGVAEKTAAKYLRGELKATTKAAKSIASSRDVIDLTRQLVALPLMGRLNLRS